MGLFNNNKKIYNNKNPTKDNKKNSNHSANEAWIKLEFDDLVAAMRKNYVDTSTVEGAEKLSAVAAAHRILTNSIASLPFMVRQKKGEIRTEPDHEIEYILKSRPNKRMTPYMLKKVMVSQAFWHGTSFCYVGYDGAGKVSELVPLPSAGYSMFKDADTDTIWYSFTSNPNDPADLSSRRKFSEDELIIHHFESHDGYVGRGFLQLASQSTAADGMAQAYNQAFYKNGAKPTGVISAEAELDEDIRLTIREDFERMVSGIDNAFRIAVLDFGMKYTPLGITQQDAQFLESRTFAVSEISRFTGIPVYMLQEGKQSYQSNEQQQIDFVINTLTPHIVQLEQEFTYKLLSENDRKAGFYIKLNEAALLRGDNKARAEYYQKMTGLGIFNQDECRALEDKSPLPDGLGQNYWMSKNYDTIENIRNNAVAGNNAVVSGKGVSK